MPLEANPRSNPSPDGPPNLGTARDSLGEYSWSLRYSSFTDLYGLSWEIILVISRVSIPHGLLVCMYVFFSENRPLEKLPHQSGRALRGEVDSSIPRVSGGF